MLSVAVGSSVAAIGLGLIYWAARIGFDNPVTPVVASIGLALLFINIPVLASSALEKFGGANRWLRSYSFLWLVTFAMITGLGRAAVNFAGSPAIGVAVFGAIAFAVVLSRWIRTVKLKSAILLIAGSGWFASWAGGVVWGRIYKSPLLIEMLISNGIVHHDGIALAALGNMLRTYHAASVGLDGLPYMAYHWGTPWLFGQLSNLTGQSVLGFYQLGYPVTMIPLFFGGVLAFANQMRKGDSTRGFAFWAVFLGATIGLLPVTGLDAIGVWTSNLTISESYAVAIPFGLMLAATIVEFWRERGEIFFAGNATALDFGFLALILTGGLVIVGYLKISVMILGFVAVAWAALRAQAWKRLPFVILAVWVSVWVFITYKRVSLVAHHEGIVPLDFLRSFVPLVGWPFFILGQLFWSLLYIGLRLRQENARTVSDVMGLVRARRILDLEIVAVIAVLGLIPGFVLHIDGGSAFYFSDVQRWFSVGLLLAGASALFPRLKVSGLAKAALVFISLPFIASTARNSVHWTIRMLRANAELRHSLYPPEAAAQLLPGIRSLPRLTDPSILAEGLRRSANYNPVTGLLTLANTPVGVKRRTAVFVPQREDKYWTILKRPNACGFSGFLVPSLTGMSMVDGMPHEKCRLSPYYGISLFEKRSRPQTESDLLPATVCARAVRLGFERVIQLHFDEAGRMSSSAMECSKPT